MSNEMLRNMYKGPSARLPPPLPVTFNEDDDEDDEEQGHSIESDRDLLKNFQLELDQIALQESLPAVHPSKLAKLNSGGSSSSSTLLSPTGSAVQSGGLAQDGGIGPLGLGKAPSNRYAPIDWFSFFDTKRFVAIPDRGLEPTTDNETRAQDLNKNGNDNKEPRTVFNVYESKSSDPKAPLFVLHHGAGHCALAFALTAQAIRQITNGGVNILCYDCRGHGETRSDDEHNLSLDRLATDLVNVLEATFGVDLPTEIVLVGHSMGGSVVAEAASRNMVPNLLGIALLDIVEGFAIEALTNIHSWLERRPTQFKSLDKVVQWGLKSGTVRNLQSARVSFPPLVNLAPPKKSQNDGSNNNNNENQIGTTYIWRTDLAASEQYWKGWFEGLTAKFLSAKTAKLLVLAGTDRLDKDMTIAQMQGKFQLLVFSSAGHAVQEDDPNRMANELVAFWKRNERLVLPVHRQL